MKQNLTKRENQIMELFWNSDTALSANDVYMLDPSLNKNTIQAVLRKLKRINYIDVDDIGYTKNVLTRLYKATVSQEEHMQHVPTSLKLVVQFVQNEATLSDLEVLEEMIENKRKEMEAK